MSPSGIEYAVFLPLVLLLYWGPPRRVEMQNGILLIASALFYASWSPEWLPLLAAAILLDFWVARYLDGVGRADVSRRFALGLSLAANVGALFWFKYRGFFAQSLNGLLETVGIPTSLPALELVLPVGLSYYTLIKIGYVLDVYHRRVPAVRSLLTFATFVAFFPQMIAGPITRAGRLLPQLDRPRRLDAAQLGAGSGAFLLGWWMKGYVADWIAPAIVDPIFSAPGTAGLAAHWLALLGYAVQVFCDFAGYSLMAIGTAAFLGLELPVNFDRPFLSRSMSEFWRRWHISLNTWLFDYLYAPWVTGRGWLRGQIALTLVLVFALSGLWHGARWTFVLWGLAHGVALAIHHNWDVWYRAKCRADRRWVERRRSAAYSGVAWVLTQSWFVGSLILFRAEGVGDARAFVGGLFGAGEGLPLELDAIALLNLLAAFGSVVVHHLLGLPAAARVHDAAARVPVPIRGIMYGAVIVWLLIFAPLGRGTFIYAQF